MKKKIATNELLALYNIIGAAKNTKLDDGDKIKMWKICRKMKPIADKFDEDMKSATEAMKPEGFDDELKKAQEYERLTKAKEPTIDVMTKAQYDEFIEKLKKYNELVQKAVEENGKKEVTLEYEPLSEDAFGKLLSSNDWNNAQVIAIGDFVCGE